MNIGRPAAVHGVADGRMLGELVLQIHDRPGAADEQDGIPVVQAAHFIRGEQLFATMSSDEFKKGKHYQDNFSCIVLAFCFCYF